MAYVWMLALHNVLRWVVVVVAVVTLVRMFSGVFRARPWQAADTKWGKWFTMALDIQLLVGLVLYFVLSPLTTAAMANMGAAMSDSTLRFFAVEHSLMMVVAVVLAHVGAVLVRRATTDAARFRRGAIWFTLTVLIIAASIPWDRPLLRGLS